MLLKHHPEKEDVYYTDYLQQSPNYSRGCYVQRPSRYSQIGKLFSGAPTPKSSSELMQQGGKHQSVKYSKRL